jgi:hypothetical protein
MDERTFETILAKYPELIENGLEMKGRQVSMYGRRMDLLFDDAFQRKLIIELKVGPIKDQHMGQVLSYEGMLLSADDPTIRVMLIGNRVPPNIRKALDHHGIAWKEIPVSSILSHLRAKSDSEMLSLFSPEETEFSEQHEHKTIVHKSSARDSESGSKPINIMKNIEVLKNRLLQLEAEVNSNGEIKIQFHQQSVQKKHMCFLGGNGRLWVSPSSDGYDITLSGKSLENQMYTFMRNLCGKECDGYKQTNAKIGKNDAPFWRVNDFKLVKDAVLHYAETKK